MSFIVYQEEQLADFLAKTIEKQPDGEAGLAWFYRFRGKDFTLNVFGHVLKKLPIKELVIHPDNSLHAAHLLKLLKTAQSLIESGNSLAGLSLYANLIVSAVNEMNSLNIQPSPTTNAQNFSAKPYRDVYFVKQSS